MKHQTAVKTTQSETQACGAKANASAPKSIHQFRELQQSIGNRALGHFVQAKLNISEPGDEHEQEADRVADQVMRMPSSPTTAAPQIQRKCDACEEDEEPIQRKADFNPGKAESGINSISGGQPLSSSARAFFEPRFGYDFSAVRVHTDSQASESAKSIDALAYTKGKDIVFAEGQYAAESSAGQRLLAHELTHVVQQGAGAVQPDESLISRAPVYPDTSCSNVADSITRAWPTAMKWVQLARSRLSDASGVASALQTHFKLDPNNTAHASDLGTVRQNFARMEEIFDMDVANQCRPADRTGECRLADGRIYDAFVRRGRVDQGITHCIPSADVSFLGQENLIDTLVHEVSHLADPASTDHAFRHQTSLYENLTRDQAIRNAASYSEFARELYGVPPAPLLLSLSTGALLSAGTPRWAISAGLSSRSRSGIEVFDLVGGLNFFVAVDPTVGSSEPAVRDVGAEINFGFISRSPQTRFFVDTRVGAFFGTDVAGEEPDRLGLSSNTLIGWADSKFRAGVNLRVLYDFLNNNHALIIGGEFNLAP